MRNTLFVAALLIFASTPAMADDWMEPVGKYDSYADYLAGSVIYGIEKAGHPAMPRGVRERFATCLAEAAVAGMSPDMLMPLDAAARGERAIPRGKTMMAEAVLMVDLKDAAKGRFDMMQAHCPDDIATFKQYLPE